MASRRSGRIKYVKSQTVSAARVKAESVSSTKIDIGSNAGGRLNVASNSQDLPGTVHATDPNSTALKKTGVVAVTAFPSARTDSSGNIFDGTQIEFYGESQLRPNVTDIYQGYDMSISRSVVIGGNLMMADNTNFYKTVFAQKFTTVANNADRDANGNFTVAHKGELSIDNEAGSGTFGNAIFEVTNYPPTGGFGTNVTSGTDPSNNPIITSPSTAVTTHRYGFSSISSSDDRLKHNETKIQDARAVLAKLVPLVYDKTNMFLDAKYTGPLDAKLTPYHKESGFIAQEVEKIPELKHLVIKGNDTTSYSLNYVGLLAFVVGASQEMSNEIEELKRQHQTLMARMEALEKKSS